MLKGPGQYLQMLCAHATDVQMGKRAQLSNQASVHHTCRSHFRHKLCKIWDHMAKAAVQEGKPRSAHVALCSLPADGSMTASRQLPAENACMAFARLLLWKAQN